MSLDGLAKDGLAKDGLAKDGLAKNKRQVLWEKLWNKLERIRAEKQDFILYPEDHLIITVYDLGRDWNECGGCGVKCEQFLMNGYIKAAFLDKLYRYSLAKDSGEVCNSEMYCKCEGTGEVDKFIAVFECQLTDSDIPIYNIELDESDVV